MINYVFIDIHPRTFVAIETFRAKAKTFPFFDELANVKLRKHNPSNVLLFSYWVISYPNPFDKTRENRFVVSKPYLW